MEVSNETGSGILARARIGQRVGHRFTPAVVNRARHPGRLVDGNGLWLIVDAPDRRYWNYRYQWQGRTKSVSFGSADRVGLAEARALHAEARLKAERGIDPQARRRAALEMLRPRSAAQPRESFAFAAADA